MKSNQKNNTETHPLFPSGEWEGFYVYGANQGQHRMDIVLNFQNNIVEGAGIDDVGAFSWSGQYDTETFRCQMIKTYAGHTVEYDGRVDENGIWGNWRILPWMKGGFHIWPKNNTEENQAEEERVEEKVKKRSIQKVGVGF